MKGLSILIPEYNCDCTKLVHDLYSQCISIKLDFWEIIVADDGSKEKEIANTNRCINKLDRCTFIENTINVGRSAIRNFLAEKANYERLLFIDSDMCLVKQDFIFNYMKVSAPIVYGGYCTVGKHNKNLRYIYEHKSEESHRASERRKNCYADFHTSNYCIYKKIQIAHPLDTTYQGYGYEDVAYGAKLRELGIPIIHIDNPVGFYNFESNDSYLLKIEESLYTLYKHRSQLKGYSRLINIANILKQMQLEHISCCIFERLQKKMREQLIINPNLMIFSLYKIGYYIALIHRQEGVQRHQ